MFPFEFLSHVLCSSLNVKSHQLEALLQNNLLGNLHRWDASVTFTSEMNNTPINQDLQLLLHFRICDSRLTKHTAAETIWGFSSLRHTWLCSVRKCLQIDGLLLGWIQLIVISAVFVRLKCKIFTYMLSWRSFRSAKSIKIYVCIFFFMHCLIKLMLNIGPRTLLIVVLMKIS